jgi:putative transcriptional regulator
MICHLVEMLVISYKRLWKLLTDCDMNKQDLQVQAKISPSSVAKLSKHQNISMDVLLKLFTAQNVNIGDITVLIPSDQNQEFAA